MEPVVESVVRQKWWPALRRNPNASLLAIQLLSILIYPFLEGSGSHFGRSMFSLLGLLVLVMAIRAVNATPMFTWVGFLLLAPCVVLTVVDGVLGWVQPWHVWSDVFHMLFYAYTTISLIVYMFRDTHVTSDELFAVGACFTVAVWTFAYAFSIIQYLVPGSFVAASPGETRGWFELLFLSCTTMTSTGLSDVVPVRPHARAVVMVEQIAGMLYIAMVVARLVAMGLRRHESFGTPAH
ncbi:ion channel [Aestuariimicrobium ganziense]|uniref:ion channel n=1 Tax=Aestuariimicrobium ganziense TaxID=2773677 RepID=UPI001943F58F|nr:ion channel [Aestuariimicrobium ganziense]